jgi:hypothetical protein
MMFVGGERKQIPFGDDKQKGNDNDTSGRGLHLHPSR